MLFKKRKDPERQKGLGSMTVPAQPCTWHLLIDVSKVSSHLRVHNWTQKSPLSSSGPLPVFPISAKGSLVCKLGSPKWEHTRLLIRTCHSKRVSHRHLHWAGAQWQTGEWESLIVEGRRGGLGMLWLEAVDGEVEDRLNRSRESYVIGLKSLFCFSLKLGAKK